MLRTDKSPASQLLASSSLLQKLLNNQNLQTLRDNFILE